MGNPYLPLFTAVIVAIIGVVSVILQTRHLNRQADSIVRKTPVELRQMETGILQTALDAAHAQLRVMIEETDRLQASRSADRATIARLDDTVAQLTQTVAEMSERADAREQRIAVLQGAVDDLTSQLASAADKLQTLREELASLNPQMENA